MHSQEKNMLIERYARGRETSLIEKYIADGPAVLREELGLSETDWQVIFDYLAFEQGLLFKCVTQTPDFFVENYIKHGATHVRDILNIREGKYDMVWEVLFDFIGIAKEGVYYHFLHNRDRYVVAFRARGGDFVRKVLGLWKEKYEENWLAILDGLLHGVCDEIFSEQTFDHGLKGFARMMNGEREHRPVVKHLF